MKTRACLILLSILFAIVAIAVGCGGTGGVTTASPKKTVIGKWRELETSSFEIIEFNKKEVTVSNVSNYHGGDLPEFAGQVYQYSFPEPNTLQISFRGEKMNNHIKVISMNLIEITESNGVKTIYHRWSDHGKDSIKGAYFFNKGRYEKALPFLETAAEGGDLDAQYYLAKMYFHGKGVKEKNIEIAAKWANQSAAGNFGKSAALLGLIYTTHVQSPDYENAIASYEKAIALGAAREEDQIKLLWIYATASEKYRDGEKALTLAAKAKEAKFRFKNKIEEDRILAAAYAAAGDFETAKKHQNRLLKRIQHSRKAKWIKLRKEAKLVLDTLYAQGKPYSTAEGAKIAKMVEDENTRVAALSEKATTETKTLGTFNIEPNGTSNAGNLTTIKISDVVIAIKYGTKNPGSKKWKRLLFRDIKSISLNKQSTWVRKGKQRVSVAVYGLSIYPNKRTESLMGFSSNDQKMENIYKLCAAEADKWRQTYPELCTGKLEVSDNL